MTTNPEATPRYVNCRMNGSALADLQQLQETLRAAGLHGTQSETIRYALSYTLAATRLEGSRSILRTKHNG